MTLVKNRVLIVDNEDGVRMALEARLQEAGCCPTATWSGVEALSLLKSSPFDVLLVDDYLAHLYVGEFLKQVSELPVQPRVLVMQANPTKKGIRFRGTAQVWPIVDKTEIAEVVEVVLQAVGG